MRAFQRLNPIGAAAFVAVCYLFLPLTPSDAQETDQPKAAKVPSCNITDFDTNVRFLNGPADYFTVAFDMLNISARFCVLDGPLPGPSFNPDPVSGGKPFAFCRDCQDKPPTDRVPALPHSFSTRANALT